MMIIFFHNESSFSTEPETEKTSGENTDIIRVYFKIHGSVFFFNFEYTLTTAVNVSLLFYRECDLL